MRTQRMRHARRLFAATRRSTPLRAVVAASIAAMAISGHGGPAHAMTVNRPFVGITATTDGHGYWLVGSDGGIFTFGNAAGYGSTGSMSLNAPIVGVASTGGHGYWLAARDGGVFPFGDAGGYGAATGSGATIVGIAATRTGHGYWLAGSDGSVRNFGDAVNAGNATALHPAAIVGIAASPLGHGYWLAGADGGVFPFGDAVGYGSLGGTHLNAPVVGITGSAWGGYWLAAGDGGVFPFGPAGGYGSAANANLNQPVRGIVSTPTARGYWLVARDGGVFPYGDAGGYGSLGGSAIAFADDLVSGGSYTGASIVDIVRAAALRHGVDPNWMLKIMYCESGGRVNAINPSGPYIGLFQFLPSTFHANGGVDIYDPYQQAEVTATMLSHGQAHQWSCA